MKDYLLKFQTKQEAVQFGLQSGFVAFDENKEPYTTLATHTYAVAIIGPWVQITPAAKEGEEPLVESDDRHWVLFRDLVGLKVPEGAEKYIFWTSDDGPRPENCPQDAWSGDGDLQVK